MANAEEKRDDELSEFERKRVLKSFENLLDLCKRDPVKCVRLLNQLSDCTTPYSMEAAGYYLLGMILGVASSHLYHTTGHSFDDTVEIMLRAACRQNRDQSPEYFMGPNRILGR